MKVIILIFAFIGLLKLVSLFILATIQVYCHYKYKQTLEFNRTFSWFKISNFYIIPTICFEFGNKLFYIRFVWLNFEYYENTEVGFIENI